MKYDKAIEELKKNNHGTNINELCKSPVESLKYPWRGISFDPFDYSTEPVWEINHHDRDGSLNGWKHKWDVIKGANYDIDSIMHYTSLADLNFDTSPGTTLTVNNAVIVQWKEGKPDYNPPSQVTKDNAVLIPNNWKKWA
jgi:hypothetical protein